MEKCTNEIILAFIGEPASPESPCTKTGYGYDAFVCTDHTPIVKLFQSLCLWGGSTKSFIKGNDYYRYYELSCQDREFFESDYFKRICKPYNVDITVITDSKELYDKFYRDARTRY